MHEWIGWKEENWIFLNMNSPADLYAFYGDGKVMLEEYDRCRDGHGLISGFYVEDEVFFQTEVADVGAGVGIGLYYGDGCFSRYCMVIADREGISIRVPSGIANGDTFRMDGAQRYVTAASIKMKVQKSFSLGFLKQGEMITVFCNDCVVIEKARVQMPFQTTGSSARLIVKAMNEYGDGAKLASTFAAYYLDKKKSTYCFNGICADKLTGQRLGNVYVHVMGDFGKWAVTDKEGKFTISDLPFGSFRLVFGMIGKEFEVQAIVHDGFVRIIELEFGKEQERSCLPQENLQVNVPVQPLNGIWEFEFDRDDVGVSEKWFVRNNHFYQKCIRVPFSWQSLMAFGEEELADAYTLHQANTFTCNAKETGEIGWYQRRFRVDWLDGDSETELIFAAVAGISTIWLDGQEIGCIVDSYNQSVFCLGQLTRGIEYNLTMRVSYEHGNDWACSGKQGFWFTDSPGIWQNVWLRERRQTSITDILVNSSLTESGKGKMEFQLELDTKGDMICTSQEPASHQIECNILHSGYVKVSIYYQTVQEITAQVTVNGYRTGIEISLDAVHGSKYYDKLDCYLYLNCGKNRIGLFGGIAKLQIRKMEVQSIMLYSSVDLFIDRKQVATLKPSVNLDTGTLSAAFTYVVEGVKLWDERNPYLYLVTAKLNENGYTTEYRRTVGVRTVGISCKDDKKGSYLTFNNQKKYIRGVLDQGYNPWGIYSYKNIVGTEPGSVSFDILAAKKCGYNLMRMHVKDNEPEWYQTCDETGMLVWDELPSNFYGKAADNQWQGMYKRQLKQMIRKHNYHPSVVLFSTINESWGITGDHEKSPWDDAEGQILIKEYAKYYRRQAPNVLVIDNSGYAKTSATQIIDHHAYPDGWVDAADFFKRLEKQNYEGSHFNFFNVHNRELMEDDGIRDLLQRNCSQDLKKIEYKGNEVQKSQPVFISEFVHTDKQEELVRIFPQIAGYVRMNIASQENEDTSPLTATRVWRDFGFVRSDFSSASYAFANSENLLYLDSPFLSKVTEQEEVIIPVYMSLWEPDLPKKVRITLKWELIGIDYMGSYRSIGQKGLAEEKIEKENPVFFADIKFAVPKGFMAVFLFAKAYTDKKILAENYIQFEIFPVHKPGVTDISAGNIVKLLPEHIISKSGFLYTKECTMEERNLVWGFGRGEIIYRIPVPAIKCKKAKLCMELSSCICMDGARETDESADGTKIQIYIDDIYLTSAAVAAQSCDRRGLFSNSASTEGKIVKHSQTGVYGYGERIEVAFSEEIIEKMLGQCFLTISLKTGNQGIIVYGNRMGRYGCDPMIVMETEG